MDFIIDKFAERIGGHKFGQSTDIYKFEKIKRAKKEAVKNNPGKRLIDMGVGEPDKPADSQIVEVLAREAGKHENRFYSDNGIPEFQDTAASYLQKVYGVTIYNPQEEIIHGIGSKPILAMLPICFINLGDYSITTVPGYPVLSTYTKYLGGSTYDLHLSKSNDFYPDFNSIPPEILKRTKLLYLNYPNNPTGQVATVEFFKKVVEFAHKYKILVVHDSSYSAVVFDGYKPLSFLSVDGARDIGIEIFSLSKAFNMTGWRLAFLAGNSKLIKAYGTVKDNTDSGQFRAIQKAGVFALNHPELTDSINQKYSRRFDLLIRALKEVGFDAKKPHGTFYCYVPIPVGTKKGHHFINAEEVSQFLIRECLISTVPWDDAGSFLRFSVTFEAESEQDENDIINEMKERIKKVGLVF